ncbi:DNA polymerase III subunit gamma and tau [Pseudarthrobacter sp. NS4]|uniref:DNA polymerase III subunit gamma and tau n=1 Tax=Pseudarthrobacter sp. NS4 TaxID=2973976 RepID=UPI002162B83E|nr:DNA polymerase III subunit gamma and tau [Pseudarthrobacter sp. NS4]
MSARIGRVFSVTVTTALYRRYRPDSFADVIGQEHVTEPLMTALRKNRVNHAYLFSGPRGCGKTTSARILARCLNCAKGPTDTPCGTCPSCLELARGGSGSLDVIEIDAASHGGVDDARDLRERATYAPVRDRYKIFIIDEAHMVTSAGFNALLKIVEEPPEHIKFIFATTEPDKVIGTIRSRTHHYPFRLVPPEPLMAYLELLCNQENVPVAPGVLSLVIRAGGGSVRDSLSVLDQLMAGAGPNGLDYELAVALLGYTHASLLDDVVEAVAASDAATVFRAVDRVIQTGHDPRRFVEDLLERFRDLIIVQAMPESAQAILRGMPADQIARLQNQAHNLGAAELSRAADVTNTALTEMTGATSPRLHLELLCARILLPSSEQNERGMAARIDRVERRLNYAGNDVGAPAGPGAAGAAATASGGGSPVSQPAAAAAATVAMQPQAAAQSVPAPPVVGAGANTRSAQSPEARPTQPEPPGLPVPPLSPGDDSPQPVMAGPAHPAAGRDVPGPAGDAATAAAGREPLTAPRVSTSDWPVEEKSAVRPPAERPAPARPAPERSDHAPAAPPAALAPARTEGAAAALPATNAGAAAAQPVAPAAMGDVEVLRRAWPDVLQTLSKIKRSTWALVEPNAQVSAFDGTVLTLSFTTTGLAGAFGRADHSENLRQAIHKTVGIDCQIHAVAGGSGQASSEPNPKALTSQAAPATSADVAWGLAPAPAPSASAAPTAAPAPSTVAETAPASARTAPASAAPTASVSPAPPHSAAGPGPEGPRPAATRKGSGSGSSAVAGAGGAAAAGTGHAHADHETSVPARPPQEAPGRPAAGSTQQPQSAAPAATGADPYTALAGDYSYSDDDWGPPRDEDAPPLDEEPPLDWQPSAQAGSKSTSAEASARNPVSAGSQQETGTTSGAVEPKRPAAPDAVHDPWTRAVEQAPGVWVVGNESNIGRTPPATTPEEESGSVPTPRYEPATAQVPPSIPVTTPGTPTEPDWGLASAPAPTDADRSQSMSSWATTPAPSSPMQSYPLTGSSESKPVRAPEYAMASAVPTAGPAAAAPSRPAPAASPAPTISRSSAPSPAVAPAAGTGETRQSLYQRLSNSPEAEAGRAKAPARAVAAAATYVQDIPSADDETIEESGVFGRAAVERILGGKLIEERSPDGSPIPPRY